MCEREVLLLRRSIDSWLDRFCYRHPRLGIPNLMLIVIAGTAVVYLLDMFSGAGLSFSRLISFSPYYILHGQIWRLVTFVFVPMNSSPLLLFLSLYFYYFIGSALEQEWGSVKFTVFYGMGVLLNIIVGFLTYLPMAAVLPKTVAAALSTASMTYVNLSLFFAFATLYPDMQMLLFFILPIKVKWLAWIDAALFAWGILSSLFSIFTSGITALTGVIIPVIAILNYVLFFWSEITGFLGRSVQRTRHQHARQTVNFRQATRQAQQQKGYIHKCAVCGKTDTEYPDLEFRYCSKCNGYYCYCMEHINNHVHIQ